MRRLPVYLLIDTSGSMGGVSIEQARQGLLLALDRLRPGDRFNVIEFNSSPNALFNESLELTPQRLRQAKQFVQGLHARGGTEMRAALDLALRDAAETGFLRQVIFMTDGAVGNEAALFKLIHEQLNNSRLYRFHRRGTPAHECTVYQTGSTGRRRYSCQLA